MRTQAAVLEHVLAIEMRAFAVGRRHGVQHGQFLRGVTRVEELECRVQAEGGIERQGRVIAGFRECDLATQRGVSRIADRRHRRQSIERTAQQYEDEARIGGRIREREARSHHAGGSGEQ